MFRPAALSLLSPQPAPSHLMGRIGRTVLACTALALLSACGGGDRAEEYQPDRVVVFGDENSAFADHDMGDDTSIKGLTYTVNPVLESINYCDVAPLSPDACEGFLSGTFGSFVAPTDSAAPYGAGSLFIDPDAPDAVNTVYMLTPGTLTYTPPAGVETTASVKRDRRVAYVCEVSSTAFQRVAHGFGKGFSDNCTGDASGAKTFAVAGAKIAGLQDQVNQALSENLLGKGALVTVWIGQNDIMEVVMDNAIIDKRKEVNQRADSLAQVIKQIIDSGAKVAVIAVADIGYSPWAAVSPRVPDDVKTLVDDFNTTLQFGNQALNLSGLNEYRNRGRSFTFVDAGQVVRDLAASSTYVNAAVCPNADDVAASPSRAALPSLKPDGTVAGATEVQYCTSGALVNDGNLDTYIWADAYRPARLVHMSVANIVLTRAANQF